MVHITRLTGALGAVNSRRKARKIGSRYTGTNDMAGRKNEVVVRPLCRDGFVCRKEWKRCGCREEKELRKGKKKNRIREILKRTRRQTKQAHAREMRT